MQQTMTSGTLWVVATPIGNLDDISQRALQILAAVDLIAAEDTRHSRSLLNHFGIHTRTCALHDYNERSMVETVLRELHAGKDVALVSDAGTPLISDPGFRLVRRAHTQGIKVSPVPGASAVIAALSVAGLPSDRFVFEGFLPAKPAARKACLDAVAHEPRTLVFYESSHRIVASLEAMLQVFGATRAVVMARELTKRFETVLSLPLGELLDCVRNDDDQQRGEFVLLVAGHEAEAAAQLAEGHRVFALLRTELAPAKAAKLAAAITGAPRRELYK